MARLGRMRNTLKFVFDKSERNKNPCRRRLIWDSGSKCRVKVILLITRGVSLFTAFLIWNTFFRFFKQLFFVYWTLPSSSDNRLAQLGPKNRVRPCLRTEAKSSFRKVAYNLKKTVWLLMSRKWILALIYHRLSQWSRGLRHELSSPARTLGTWVRIPLKTWMSVFILCLC
jgi:hypothetical protein